MRVSFVDLHASLLDAALAAGWQNDDDVELLGWTDVRDVKLAPGTAFVSPANSLGFMDGGIDYVLSREMFPGVEERVKRAIEARGRRTSLGRPYLPIGEALVVEAPGRPGVYLVSAPTMWLPQDVRGTRNAYHAMHAVLRAAAEHGSIERLVLCGLCTGCGMVPPAEAVAQMMLAWRDWREGAGPRWSPEEVAAEQPRVYMNVEFEPSILQDLTRPVA